MNVDKYKYSIVFDRINRFQPREIERFVLQNETNPMFRGMIPLYSSNVEKTITIITSGRDIELPDIVYDGILASMFYREESVYPRNSEPNDEFINNIYNWLNRPYDNQNLSFERLRERIIFVLTVSGIYQF